MLSKDVWFDAAKRANLKIGERRRFGHNCGPGDVVIVTHHVHGLEAYCFRCDDRRTEYRELSLAEKLQAIKAKTEATEAFHKCELPRDFTLDIPSEHAVWLYKGGITKDQARGHGFGWSPGLKRIVLPIYDDEGELALLQARAVNFPYQTPKYLNTSGASAGRVLFQTEEITQDSPFVVVTEDILSAIRCGKFGPAAALCGVSMNDAKANRLVKAKTILCWLDPDPAGQAGMRKLMKMLRLRHPDVRKVESDRDPKFLSNSAIQQHIERVLNGRQPRDNSPTATILT